MTWQLGRRLSHCGAGCVGNLTQAVGWCFYGGMGASLDKSAIFVSDVPWNKPSSELGDPPFMERLIWLTFLLKHAEFVRHNGSWISPIFMSHESDTVDGCEILQFVDGLSHWNLYMMYIYIIFYHTCTYEITRENPWRMAFALHKGHASFLVWWSGGTLLLGTLWRMRSLCTDLRFSEAGQPWKVSVSMEVSMGKTWESHGNIIYEWRFNENILYR